MIFDDLYKSNSSNRTNEVILSQSENKFTFECQDDASLFFILTNKIFEVINFYDVESLNSLITTICFSIKNNTQDQLFSSDFCFTLFYDNIFNSLLSFDGDLVYFTSKLFLTLSYLKVEAISYLSSKISELVAVFKIFYQNRYLLILLQNIFIDFPSSISDALNFGILTIFDALKNSSQKKDIKIVASIVQFITLNVDLLNQEQIDLCINLAREFLLINDKEIFSYALLTILHFQEKFEISPNAVFNDVSFNILLDQLSNHHNILPIIQVLSHFYDDSLTKFLMNNNFPLIINDIVQNENETISNQILVYLIDQIKKNNTLAAHFSFLVCLFGNNVDDISFHLKTTYFRFFMACLKTNFNFVFHQAFFEYIFCLIFDLFEELPQNSLGEIICVINCLVIEKRPIRDFIAFHPDCYQAIYNLCINDDQDVEQNAQNIISIIKGIE